MAQRFLGVCCRTPRSEIASTRSLGVGLCVRRDADGCHVARRYLYRIQARREMGQLSLVHGRRGRAGHRDRPLRIPEARPEVVTPAFVGWMFPALTAAVVVAVTHALGASASVARGVTVGMLVAVAQSYASTASLRWAWNRSTFWWIWGGGVLARMLVFAVTAFVVYRYTDFHFVATMASMVVSTTVFLVVESATCLKG